MRAVCATATTAIVVVLCGVAAAGSTPAVDDEREPLAHFRRAVEAYMKLHEAVERSLPSRGGSADAADIYAATAAMAHAMRAARSKAVEGELFAEDAMVFRRVLRQVWRDADCDVAGSLAFQSDDEEPPARRPLIHDEFDWARGSFMPRCILSALPQIPLELQFRLVGRDLVIVDLHSNLIVDVLPEALPAGESWPGVIEAIRATSGVPVV